MIRRSAPTLYIKHRTTEEPTEESALMTATTLTEAVTIVLRERLALVHCGQDPGRLLDDIRVLQTLARNTPNRDMRSEDELLGYGEFGLPR